MARSVLDASALLAYLRREPGWEQVLQAFTGTGHDDDGEFRRGRRMAGRNWRG